jgi:glucose-1-phosphate thymidylyltransferase
VVIESGAAVRGSDLIGPLWIGPHARVHNARLGPFVSVGAHARIEGATLGNVLVDEFTRILSPGGPITRAIIGRHALVTAPTDTGPQLVIGDGSIMRC